jgi:hypothetical protein
MDTMMDVNERKRMTVLHLLVKGQIDILVNSSRLGVIAPSYLLAEPYFKLQLGLFMAKPIPDLSVEEDGIRCTLSFSGSSVACAFPWNSIFLAILSDRSIGAAWPEYAPPEYIGVGSVHAAASADANPELPATGTDAPRHTQMRPPPMPTKKPKKPRPAWLGLVKKEDEGS